MRYEIWNDEGASHLFDSLNHVESKRLGPYAKLVRSFEADDFSDAKRIADGALYPNNSSIDSEASADSSYPENWGQLLFWLAEKNESSKPDQFFLGIPDNHRKDPAFIMSWICIQENHLISEINATIELLLNDPHDRIANSNEKVSQLISLRLQAAYEFVDSISTAPRCMIPYPQVSFHELLKWLLVDWWNHVGLMAVSIKRHSAFHGMDSNNP